MREPTRCHAVRALLSRTLVAAALAAATASPSPAQSHASAPPAPRYSDPAAWAALPWRHDAADEVPAGSDLPDVQATSPVDVFFLYPTTDLRRDRSNAPVDDAVVNRWTDASVIGRQAGAFNAAGRVFAPRYRQGSSGRGQPDRSDGGPAFALAYADARAAFAHYLERWNRGRPFILAGHSQGSFLLARLIEEEIAPGPLAARLVAAYLPGSSVPLRELATRFRNIAGCQAPRSTGCIVSWNTHLAAPDALDVADAARTFADRSRPLQGDATPFCVNPLTFDINRPWADAADNRGALAGEPGKVRPSLVPAASGALCIGGVLLVDPAVAAKLGVTPLAKGMMHYHDYALFYENVRHNASERARAFMPALPRRAPRR